MNLKQVYDALPEATELAKQNIHTAIQHLNALEDALDPEDEMYSVRVEEIKKMRFSAQTILDNTDMSCKRIQQLVHQLALNCRDSWSE